MAVEPLNYFRLSQVWLLQINIYLDYDLNEIVLRHNFFFYMYWFEKILSWLFIIEGLIIRIHWFIIAIDLTKYYNIRFEYWKY